MGISSLSVPLLNVFFVWWMSSPAGRGIFL